MNCLETRERLATFIYGDLQEQQRALVEKHLADCTFCQRKHAALLQASQSLDGLPVKAVDVDLPNLYQRVASQSERRARRWRT